MLEEMWEDYISSASARIIQEEPSWEAELFLSEGCPEEECFLVGSLIEHNRGLISSHQPFLSRGSEIVAKIYIPHKCLTQKAPQQTIAERDILLREKPLSLKPDYKLIW